MICVELLSAHKIIHPDLFTRKWFNCICFKKCYLL